jgi:hypothetical protein
LELPRRGNRRGAVDIACDDQLIAVTCENLAAGRYSGLVGRRDVKALNEPLLVGGFAKRDGDRVMPERDGSRVGGHLSHLPIAGEGCEQGSGRPNTDPATAVLAENEELSHVVRSARSNEREAGNVLVVSNQERMPIGFGPILIEVPVSERSMFVDIVVGEVAEVVCVEFKQMPDRVLVSERCRVDLDVA